MHTIPVTLAERPHPFPSRTRKLSSPAPKILRGQPFGKIGRRRDCCFNGASRPIARRATCAGAVPAARRLTRHAGRAILAAHDRHRRPRAPGGTGEPARPTAPSAAASTPDPLDEVCPYLVAGDGTWQSAHAIRDQRCGAVEPPAPARASPSSASCASSARTALRHVPRGPGERALDSGIARAGARRRRTEPVARRPRSHGSLVLEPDRARLSAGRASRRRPGRAHRADGRRVPRADRRAHVVAVDAGRGVARRRRRRRARDRRRRPPRPTPSPRRIGTRVADPSATAAPRRPGRPTGRTRQRYTREVRRHAERASRVKFGTTLKRAQARSTTSPTRR